LSEALHFELATLGIRVKLVEPGGVNTDFGGRSFVFTHDPEFPDYQPLVDMFTAALEEEASDDNQEPNEVAEVIFNAATDGSDQLRYISGDGAAQLLANRYSAEQDEQFVAGMRAQFGL
jgi:NAD(P)-dependent dehydrogenase (short-subunit alcohol dehydrogenase family)